MSPTELYDEERVLQLLAQGSEYAFTQIFDHYRGKEYTTAVKFLKSPMLAEEIVLYNPRVRYIVPGAGFELSLSIN